MILACLLFYLLTNNTNRIINLVNKRLDGWVMEDFLDTRKVQFPRKDGTTTGQNTGVTTPKKLVLPALPTTSRPTSPVSGNELVNGSAVLAAALQKKINRKRKVCSTNFTIFSRIIPKC